MTSDRHSSSPLQRVQGWMQTVVTHPFGVVPGAQSAESRLHLPDAQGRIDRVIRPSRRMSSADRLEIYHRAYYARLLEWLREQFPVLTATLGRESFDQFALEYLQAHPSRSYTLHDLGRRFAGFLRDTRPSAPADDPWPDFLIDLAALEWAVNEAFDAPGPEGQGGLREDDLQNVPQDHWPQLRVEVVECLRLLQLRYPLNDYYTAVRHGRQPEMPLPADSYLAVSRVDYRIRRWELTAGQFALLVALQAGATVEAALERMLETGGEVADLECVAAQVRRWFFDWTLRGWFLKVWGGHAET